MRAKGATLLGLALQLLMPWGFYVTGREVFRIAMAPTTLEPLRLYGEVLAATRYLALAACASQAGLLLVAWAALGARGRGRLAPDPHCNVRVGPRIPEK